jgi:hypothetical protein
VNEIAAMEWANYAATRAAAAATPGVDLIMREDLVLTSSEMLPLPDANHACLLRAEPERVPLLLDEVVETFHSRGMPATLYLSPACTPVDLPAQLGARGFVLQPELEAWMAVGELQSVHVPAPARGIPVRTIAREEAGTFVDIFLKAFEMDAEFAPALVELVSPSIGLDNARHFMAFSGDTPVGTMSLLVHETFAVLGSAGVIHSRDSRGAATNMVIACALEARAQGCETLMLQTTAGTMLERLLRIWKFRRVFTRSCYMLPC